MWILFKELFYILKRTFDVDTEFRQWQRHGVVCSFAFI